MIIKSPQKSHLILTLEALLRRIEKTHPKRTEIENYLSRLTAGFYGEKSMEYYFKFLPEKNYFIFHHLRLPYRDVFFQMDYLILTPKFALVSEIKSLLGSVYFDKHFKQLIQTKDDVQKTYVDPLIQVEHQRYQFTELLNKHKLKNFPIEKLVVFSNAQTTIQATPGYTDAYKHVVHKESFLQHINFLENKYERGTIQEVKEIRKLSRLLLKLHTPETINIFERFEICQQDILLGVRCTNPTCELFHMHRRRGTWVCPHCNHIDKDAHLHSLKDYERIISPTITNKQLRDFLLLNCSDSAKRILQSLNVKYTGEKKHRIYTLPPHSQIPVNSTK